MKKEKRRSPREIFNKFRKSSADALKHGGGDLNASSDSTAGDDKNKRDLTSGKRDLTDESDSNITGDCNTSGDLDKRDLNSSGDLNNSDKPGRVAENLYVTLPNQSVTTTPPIKEESPPPLPSTLPPSADKGAAVAAKPRQTMYENVWIERTSPDSDVSIYIMHCVIVFILVLVFF